MWEMVSFRVERELGSNPKQIPPDMKCKIHFYTMCATAAVLCSVWSSGWFWVQNGSLRCDSYRWFCEALNTLKFSLGSDNVFKPFSDFCLFIVKQLVPFQLQATTIIQMKTLEKAKVFRNRETNHPDIIELNSLSAHPSDGKSGEFLSSTKHFLELHGKTESQLSPEHLI